MASVTFDAITKRYDNGFEAVHSLSLDIADGEFLVLVGPSGCGKTTALRMVAGLEDVTEGELRIADRRVNDVPPKDRDIAMVFQSYALYPHMTVAQNIAFGLELRRVPKAEITRRVAETARLLALDELLGRRPKQLSGGQRQRVAMGRAIVREPKVFLMDEPLSNLDAKLRVQMRAEISRIQQRLGVTTIYVTHDQVEAMTMGQRVAVMRKGVLQQVANPQYLYDNPVNLFVAGFIGSPPMNLCEARIVSDNDALSVQLGDHRLALDPTPGDSVLRSKANAGEPVVVGIRPEDMEDGAILSPERGKLLKAKVDIIEALGSSIGAHFGIDAPRAASDEVRKGADIADLGLATEHGSTFVASFSPRSQVRPGQLIEIAVDTSRLHFFDRETGERL